MRLLEEGAGQAVADGQPNRVPGEQQHLAISRTEQDTCRTHALNPKSRSACHSMPEGCTVRVRIAPVDNLSMQTRKAFLKQKLLEQLAESNLCKTGAPLCVGPPTFHAECFDPGSTRLEAPASIAATVAAPRSKCWMQNDMLKLFNECAPTM